MSPPPPESLPLPGPHAVLIRGGSFHLSRELCDTYLSGTESVAAICREGRVMLLPLHGNAAGG